MLVCSAIKHHTLFSVDAVLLYDLDSLKFEDQMIYDVDQKYFLLR